MSEITLEQFSELMMGLGQVKERMEALKEENSNFKSQIRQLTEALDNQIDRWKMLPSGIDEDADEYNQSPVDATAHIGGLAVKEIREALARLRAVREESR